MEDGGDVSQLRAHLSEFKPSYPVQKGYIAWLLLDHSVSEVVAAIKDIVGAAEPNKSFNEGSLKAVVYSFKKLLNYKKDTLSREWPSLINLFLEQVPITLHSLPPAFSKPEHSSSPSSSEQPEQTSRQKETQVQTSIPQTSTSTELLQTIAPSCTLPSPKKLRRDCAACVAKQLINMNFVQKNKKLRAKLRELRSSRPHLTPEVLKEEIERQTQSAIIWKTKYKTLKMASRNSQTLKQTVKMLQQKVDNLESCINTTQEENKNMHVIIDQLSGTLKKIKNDNASLKLKYDIYLKREHRK